jgi:multidrug efflux system membrane fusion protein
MGRRQLDLAFPALLASLLALAGCGSEAAPSGGAPPPPKVSVAKVLAQEVRHWDSYTGRVAAVDSVELRPRVTGHVVRVAYQEGAFVRRGDLLFVIDPRRHQANLNRAVADLARARSEAQLAQAQNRRAQTLIDAKAISQEEFEARRASAAQGAAGVQAAQAAVAAARLELQYSRVLSPISGRAGRALVTPGDLAQADVTLLTTVVSSDPVHVYFEADERAFLGYGTAATVDGDPINIRIGLANDTGYHHTGRVDFIDNQLDPNTGTIRARAVVPNPDGAIVPGLFARVQLQRRKPQPVLLVSDRAILTDQDRKYVYVLGPQNVAVRKDITVGRAYEGLRVVDGLRAGDRVIVEGVQRVFAPGMAVDPDVVPMGGARPLARLAR